MKKYFVTIILLVIVLYSMISVVNASSISKYPYEEMNLSLTENEINTIKIYQNKTLNIASFANSEKNKYIFKEISKAFGFKINFIEYNGFSDGLEAVIKGECSLISNVTYTDERSKVLNFSVATDVDIGHLYANDINVIKDMTNVSVAVEKGTSWIATSKKLFPHSTLVEFTGIDGAIKLFEDGKIDAVLCSDKFYSQLIEIGKYPIDISNMYSSATTSIAGTKVTTDTLISVISKYTKTHDFEKKMQQYNKLYYKTADEHYLNELLQKSNLDKNKIYKVAIVEQAPYAMKNNTEYYGVFPDVFKEAFKDMGLKYEILSNSSINWGKTYDDFLAGKIDVAMPMIISADRMSKMNFTVPLTTVKAIMVKRANSKNEGYTNINQAIYENIGLIISSHYLNFFEASFPKKKFEIFDSEADLINALKTGKVDYIPLGKTDFLQYVKRTKDLSIVEDTNITPFSTDDVAIAFANNEEGKTLANIFSVECRLIDINSKLKEYVDIMNYEQYYKDQNRYIRALTFILLLIITLITITLLRLRTISRQDPLTKILNRYALMTDYKLGINEDETMIFFDLNKFKEFNDVYGHAVGDEVIKNFVNSYKGTEKFNMYRIGGDEFVTITNFNTKKIKKEDYIDLFLKQEVTSKLANFKYTISSSIGILDGSSGILELDKAMSIADMAMYEAKSSAVSKIHINDEILKKYLDKIQFRKDLENAILNNELFSHFQPLYKISTGKISGIEVFSKWELNGEPISADKYLAEAKILGLSTNIDNISLSWAVKCYNELKSHNLLNDDIVISVNICEQTLNKIYNGDVLLDSYNIPKNLLRFEIKEDVVIDDVLIQKVEKIIESGHTVAIDDFGAGNTSLKYIRNDIFRIIKIDKSLLPTNINNDIKGLNILKSQIEILTILNKYFAIDGVETKEQYDFLINSGVKVMQGNYMCKPLPLNDLIEVVTKTNGN